MFALIGSISFQACAMDCGAFPVMETHGRDGTKVALVIPSSVMTKTSKWSPGKGEPLLSVGKAADIALKWAREHYKRFDSVEISEIQLNGRGCWGTEGYWYYQVTFTPIMDGNQLWGAAYFAAVLFDGTVVEPTSSK